MSFVAQLCEEHRSLFIEAAEQLALDKGDYLIRRGEPGGDVFLVDEGGLEVVDSRSSPEVILAVLEAGSMVGEMAFIDNSPRSADVRAGAASRILRWPREDLRALLARQPDFAAAFYKNIAKVGSDRIRALTTTAVAGAISSRDNHNAAGLASVRDQVRAITETAKEAFIVNEAKLRQNPGDNGAVRSVRDALDRLQEAVHDLFTSHPDPSTGREAASALTRELNPYLVRSGLADRCIRRDDAMTGSAEILAHVLVNHASGDGRLGEVVDEWLLNRPTLCALRSIREPLVGAVHQALPTHRNRRVVLVNAGTGSLIAGLMEVLAAVPTVITVVDQSREALTYLDTGIAGVDLKLVRESLAQLSMGKHNTTFTKQDVVILYGLLEYLPDRLAVSLLSVARSMLTEDGVVVATALAPSADRILLDRLLGWPTIRRSRESLTGILGAAGLDVTAMSQPRAPSLMVVGRP